ncbi:MAG: amidohydrolase family protein [Solirubrobacterales bacterium]|nr:amidohydrolase family protein [Solirubrobacterales bacterium]
MPSAASMEPIDRALAPWWTPIRGLLGDQVLYDAHTHIGRNDPDGYRQEPDELIDALDPLGARAVTFPMHEPGGYPEPNDRALAAAAGAPDRIVAFCRVDPRADALAEATRCLDAGALGIKLHPRAEGFTLEEPAVEDLFALAHERRRPILIHAGRGIPALGENAVTLTRRYPDARLILAHAAVSDLAWIWSEMPDHPNLLVDTAWWSPGDMMAMFKLIPSGQIVWASDSPYGRPMNSAVTHLRFALQAGVGADALRSIAGGQIERVLAGEDLEQHGRPPGEATPISPHLERVVDHLVGAVSQVVTGNEPTEPVSLARLACDAGGDDEARPLLDGIHTLIARAGELAEEETGEVRFPPSAVLLTAALSIARTPAAPGPV